MSCLCNICERVTPRLSHANAAVVLSAVKVLMKLMEQLPEDGSFIQNLHRKLAPPLGKWIGQTRPIMGGGGGGGIRVYKCCDAR